MLRWLRARDPNWYALRRSLRAAVVVPVNFAIGSQLIGNAQVATFAAFGSFAMLIFVNFPGGRVARTGSYLVLAAAGVVLISVGTLVATPDWLAVSAMAVVAFGVLFAGVVSSTLNAGTQAALLAFILAVMLPGVRGDLPERLAGWGLAVLVAVPVAVLVWPPDDQNVLRLKAAAVCRALAAMLHLEQPPPGTGDPLVALSRAGRRAAAGVPHVGGASGGAEHRRTTRRPLGGRAGVAHHRGGQRVRRRAGGLARAGPPVARRGIARACRGCRDARSQGRRSGAHGVRHAR